MGVRAGFEFTGGGRVKPLPQPSNSTIAVEICPTDNIVSLIKLVSRSPSHLTAQALGLGKQLPWLEFI